MPGGSSGGGGAGYDYVQDSEPGAPSEGEEWYDTGANAAFVYDGTAWIEQTVVDHGQLSGVAAGNHRSDSNIVQVVDGSSLSSLDISNDFTDPAGVQHTGELADKSDLSSPSEAYDSGWVSEGSLDIFNGLSASYDRYNAQIVVADGTGSTENLSTSNVQVGDVLSVSMDQADKTFRVIAWRL